MTFRRKLFIAFTTIIILPMVLVTIAFFVIGNVLARSDGSKEFLGYSQLSENMQSYRVKRSRSKMYMMKSGTIIKRIRRFWRTTIIWTRSAKNCAAATRIF